MLSRPWDKPWPLATPLLRDGVSRQASYSGRILFVKVYDFSTLI